MSAVSSVLDKPASVVRPIRGNGSTPVEPEPFEAINISDAEAQPRDETVQGLIANGDVVALVGTPGSGKTALAVHLSTMVTAGAVFFGRLVRRGPVIYFGAEAPASVITRSKLAKGKAAPDQRLPFYVVQVAPLIGDPGWTTIDEARLIATIKDRSSHEGDPVRVVVLDTLASCLGIGDENGEGMVALVNAARRIANTTLVAVIIVHHPSKSDAAGLRGHGSLQGACDLILTSSMDEATKICTATVVKSRHGESGLQLSYKLEPVDIPTLDSFGRRQTSVVLDPLTEFKTARRRPKGAAQQRLLEELERRHRTGETAWSEAKIREALHQLGMHRNSASRSIAALQISGYLMGSPANLTLRFPPEKS
jgi:energy-coupling factor transporter ATP-binding protein EcfA2